MFDGLDLDEEHRGTRARAAIDQGTFDDLIDAEREAMTRSGQRVHKIALIKALREATPLDLRSAKEAVEGYLARRGGLDGRSVPRAAQSPTWIDDLLDAERATSSRMGRPITKISLIKALREASGLGLRDAKLAVEDYLYRKGGTDLPTGASGWVSLMTLTLVIVAAAAVAWWILNR
jgi:ribosomal protein L7/L12